MWYHQCEDTARSLYDVNRAEENFLEVLDEKVDFAFDERPQNVWP